MSEKRTVLLVDDHELVRFGVKTMYAELMGVTVEWLEAGSLQEAVDLYTSHGAVDAVLLDLNLADCKGLQGLRMFLQAHPKARVAVFSGTQDEFTTEQALRQAVESAAGPKELVLVEGADHFFAGHLTEMQTAIHDWTAKLISAVHTAPSQ